jgi:hypothetical protein
MPNNIKKSLVIVSLALAYVSGFALVSSTSQTSAQTSAQKQTQQQTQQAPEAPKPVR